MSDVSNATTILSCDDSPFALASGAASFWTTLVAAAVTYIAFYRTFVEAPASLAAFRLDVSLFQLQLTHLEADLPQESEDSPAVARYRNSIHEGIRLHDQATKLLTGLSNPMDRAVKKHPLSLRRLRAGFEWWRHGKGPSAEMMLKIQQHRSELSFQYAYR